MIRVLVVDDHPAVRASCAAYLEAQDGVEVVAQAANGREALELSREHEPDVVLMDIRMPELDGIEATRLIKSERPQTGVVLITAYEQDELAESGMKAGADEFVMKGIFGADLVQRVRRASEWTSTP